MILAGLRDPARGRDASERASGNRCYRFSGVTISRVWFNNRASGETFRWRLRWRSRVPLFPALRDSAYRNLHRERPERDPDLLPTVVE